MKSRQDKTGEQKFSHRASWLRNQPLAQLAPMFIWDRVSRTARLPHVFVILCFAAIGVAPAFAARAPYLSGTAPRDPDARTALLTPEMEPEMEPDLPVSPKSGIVTGPTIERVVTNSSGAIRIEGRGTPFAFIDVEADAKPAGSPIVGADGRWHLQTAVSAATGDIVIKTSARDTGTLWPVPGHTVHVARPVVSLTAQDHAQPSRIYEYARIGLFANGPETNVTRVRVAGEAWSVVTPSLRNGITKPFNLAQAETQPAVGAPTAEPPAGSPPQPAADAIVPPVKREAPKTPAATEPAVVPAAAPAAPESPTAAPAAPPAQPAAAPEKKQQPAPAQSASKAPPPPPDVGGISSRVQDWLARANREYQGTIVKELSRPSTGGTDADAIAAAKKREIEKAIEATKVAEAKRLEEEKKRAEQAKAEAAKSETAKATEARKKAEDLKQAAEKKAAEDAKKAAAAKPAEPAKPADDQKAAEEQKKAEAAKQAEAAKKAEAAKQTEAQKALDERKRAEDAAKAAAVEKTETARDVEAEKLRAANEAARLGEQKRVEEQKRAEQLRQLEAKRKSVEEAQRKSDEAQRRADETKRNAEAKAEERARTTEPRAAEQRPTEPRPSETAVDPSKHRRLTITINPEPIVRPRAEPTSGRPEVTSPSPEFTDRTLVADRGGAEDGVYVGSSRLRQRIRVYREATYRDTGRYARGPAVRRWVWRAKYGACRAAGRKAFAPRRYVVGRGDSLWRISERHYNAGRHYARIYRANRDRIRDPDLIYPCQRFLVPRR